MSIKDYTNEEVLKICLVAFVTLCSDYVVTGNVNRSYWDEFQCLKSEVLQRMSTSNGNNK